MLGVVFVFVREDASDVEVLADAFDQSGYSISGSESGADALNVVVWSRAAMRSEAFHAAAERALHANHVIVASLAPLPHSEAVSRAPVIDISAWDGRDTRRLDPLFEAVRNLVNPVHPSVIALPAHPIYEDAEFAEEPLPITNAATERPQHMPAAWEAPLPTKHLRAVTDEPAQPKLGAPSPRRDFRRLPRLGANARPHAALLFAVITLSAGSLLIAAAQNLSALSNPQVQAVGSVGMSLSSASAGAVGVEDVTPTEREPMFEPPTQVGHAGLEPPSARRARYQP